jgi:hypothetical protein
MKFQLVATLLVLASPALSWGVKRDVAQESVAGLTNAERLARGLPLNPPVIRGSKIGMYKTFDPAFSLYNGDQFFSIMQPVRPLLPSLFLSQPLLPFLPPPRELSHFSMVFKKISMQCPSSVNAYIEVRAVEPEQSRIRRNFAGIKSKSIGWVSSTRDEDGVYVSTTKRSERLVVKVDTQELQKGRGYLKVRSAAHTVPYLIPGPISY